VARVLSWVAVATSGSVLVAAVAGWALVNKYDGNIGRLGGVMALPGAERPPEGTRDSTTFLLVGSDSREGLAAGEGVQGRGAGYVSGQRADTIILAHLFADSEQAQLVSIPRDSFVDIPAFTDRATGAVIPAHQGKVNSSFFDGGPALLVATIEQLTDLRVDHYLQVDFEGFTAMVDRLGGVEVCLSEPAQEPDSGIDLPAGRQTVAGEQALAFVRQRKGLPQGDLDRIRRQQQFMAAIIRKTLSAGTLLNPLKLNGFLDAATESLQVDDELEIGDLRDLALRMRNASAGEVSFSTIPVADLAARRGEESVVLVDEVAAAALFDRLRRDIPPGAPDDDAEPPAVVEDLTVAPEDVAVQVFNGAGIAGLGRRVSDDLAGVGFPLAGPPRNGEVGVGRTVVRHGPGQEEAARTLSAALPGSTVERDVSLNDTLEVHAGTSYSGVTAVGVGGAPPPPAPEPPDDGPATAQVITAADDTCAP
jgi:LCP family protein required for cell wall assembly